MRGRWLVGLMLCSVQWSCAGSQEPDPSYPSPAYDAAPAPAPAPAAAPAPAPAAAPAPGSESAAADSPPGPAPGSESAPASAPEPYAGVPRTLHVSVNGVLLGENDLRAMEQLQGHGPDSGTYWYDPRSGLWGLWGHGTGGVARTGLHAAPLAREASGGSTGVLLNGRELPPGEVAALIRLVGGDPANPKAFNGHYTLDAQGNVFRARGGYLGNLISAAPKARAAGQADTCVLYGIDGERGALGHAVTVGCD